MSRRKNPPWVWWVLLASGAFQLLHWGLQTSASPAVRWTFFAIGFVVVALSVTQLIRDRLTRYANSDQRTES